MRARVRELTIDMRIPYVNNNADGAERLGLKIIESKMIKYREVQYPEAWKFRLTTPTSLSSFSPVRKAFTTFRERVLGRIRIMDRVRVRVRALTQRNNHVTKPYILTLPLTLTVNRMTAVN